MSETQDLDEEHMDGGVSGSSEEVGNDHGAKRWQIVIAEERN